jgi:hypothetical protein
MTITSELELVVGHFYDILDIGDDMWRTDFRYIGQAMSGEHVFKYQMFRNSTEPDQYIIVLVSDFDVVALVRESLD